MMSHGEVSGLTIYDLAFPKGRLVAKIRSVKGLGIEEDRYAKGGDRQVSLLDDKICASNHPGLCFQKFRPNLRIKNLSVMNLKPGEVIGIGTAKLMITSYKKCHGEVCHSYQPHQACEMINACLFATVVESGTIAIGDKLSVEN